MRHFGRLYPIIVWCFASLMTASNGFREIICGAGKSVPIGCGGGKAIAIRRLFGCDNCREDKCSESFLDKENIDHVWSRCNMSTSCNIVPVSIKEGLGLGVEYQCAANVTGCYHNNISLFCSEQQTINVTKVYELSKCPEYGCCSKERVVSLDDSAFQDCQGKQNCQKQVEENALRVHYTCEGGDNRRSIIPVPNTKSVERSTIPPRQPEIIVKGNTLSSTVIIIIVASVFGVTLLLLINMTVAIFCSPKKTSYVVTPRKPSENHILDEPVADVNNLGTVKANVRPRLKENGIHQESEFRGQGYMNLKENDLYQGLDECQGQTSNHFPEGQMKENPIYQAFCDIRPTRNNASDHLERSGCHMKENDSYEGIYIRPITNGVVVLPAHRPCDLKQYHARVGSDSDSLMKENDLYQPIPHL